MDQPTRRQQLRRLSNAELRLRINTLIEQCEKEEATPGWLLPGHEATGPYLYLTEIYTLLGLKPAAPVTPVGRRCPCACSPGTTCGCTGCVCSEHHPEGSRPMICVDPRCPSGHAHYGECPGPHRVDPA